ncbi:MAG: TetR/AcrR family transcriptional regulator [Bacillota bacterium]
MKKNYLSRRESIIISAIEIIDELGLQDLSIRELADRQGVTEPAIYRHFKNKQDIIIAILDYYSHFDDMIIKTVTDMKMGAKEGILFFNRAFAEYYENYPALTAIKFASHSLTYDYVLYEKIKQIDEARKDFLLKLIVEGQEKGEINDAFTKEELTDIIMGLRRQLILNWRMSNYGFSLKERLLKTLDSIMRVC